MTECQDSRAIGSGRRAKKLKTHRADLFTQFPCEGKNLCRNLRQARFQQEFDSGPQSGNGGMVISTRLEFLPIRGISDFALGNEIRRLHIPAANDGRIQQVAPAFLNEQNSCTGRTEHPLLRARRKKIDVIERHRKGAERLNSIDAKQGSSLPTQGTDALNINSIAAAKIRGCQSHQLRSIC